jgi:hypothetical protein
MPAASTIAAATDAVPPNAPAPQHLQALAEANRVRLARAALKRAVASGQKPAAEVVLESPWQSETMTLTELLSSQRRWGKTRTRKFLAELVHLNLSENKRIGTLTERQRELLAGALLAKSGEPAHVPPDLGHDPALLGAPVAA